MKCRYNPYELLYMYRTGDPHALGMLTKEYGGFLMNIVENSLTGLPDLIHMWEDMYQECLLGLQDAVECYREDKDSSFSTFLTIVARRRLWRYLKPVMRQRNQMKGKACYLDDAVNEHNSWYDILPQSDALNDPVYFADYNRMRENLDRMINDMKADEKAMIYAWMQGETYVSASARMGLSKKAYDGRMTRVRQKVRKEAMRGPDAFEA